MWVVNFLGAYRATPDALKHHDRWMSLADLVMPLFFFAVGFALRLGFRRPPGARPSAARLARRVLGLLLLGTALYAGPSLDDLAAGRTTLHALWKRDLHQTLVHIALATLWCLPVIGRGACARLAWTLGSAALHTALSLAFAYEWAFADPRAIDGGPLGFLTWAIPLLAGSLACDALSDAPPGVPPLARTAALGALLAAAAFGASRLSSGDDVLVQSQRAGTVTYLACASGVALVLQALASWLVDVRGVSVAPLRTIGRNALAGYLLEWPLSDLARRLAPSRDAPLGEALSACAALCAVLWAILRGLERRGWFLRL
jgi:predicted acyltransferase